MDRDRGTLGETLISPLGGSGGMAIGALPCVLDTLIAVTLGGL